MAEDIKLLIPVNGKIFYNSDLCVALQECQDAGFRALFVPEIIILRSSSEHSSSIWQKWYSTPSVRVTGTTKKGSKVVVYGHVPNHYSSDPKHIQNELKRLRDGAGYYPKKEFEKLVAMEDNMTVYVIDYETAMAWPSGVYGISKPTEDHMREYSGKINGVDMIAMNNPHARAFIGQKEPEIYFNQHTKVVGDIIGVHHSDDLDDKPRGRPLFVGYRDCNGGLLGHFNLDGDGHFVGVPESGAAGMQKNKSLLERLV